MRTHGNQVSGHPSHCSEILLFLFSWIKWSIWVYTMRMRDSHRTLRILNVSRSFYLKNTKENGRYQRSFASNSPSSNLGGTLNRPKRWNKRWKPISKRVWIKQAKANRHHPIWPIHIVLRIRSNLHLNQHRLFRPVPRGFVKLCRDRFRHCLMIRSIEYRQLAHLNHRLC